jgi:hypothetical protein
MQCDILITDNDGKQASVGYLALSKNVVTAHPKKGHVMVFSRILAEPNQTRQGKSVTAVNNPVEWFQLLPVKYNGSRLRARMNA